VADKTNKTERRLSEHEMMVRKVLLVCADAKLYSLFVRLTATSQQDFSLRTNQPPATSQQYFSLRTNQHQPSATSQTNRLLVAEKN
jgi:hypothetical protein